MPSKTEHENLWKEILRGFCVVFAISILMAFLEFHGSIAGVEGKLQDLLWLRKGPGPEMKPVVILEIDEKAYGDFFDSRSPLCPRILVPLVRQISNAGPAILGVDILSAANSPEDISIYQNFADSASNRKVVWASAGEAPDKPRPIAFSDWILGREEIAPLQPTSVLAFEPAALRSKQDVHWGPAIYPTQDDLKLRRFPRQLTLVTTPREDEITETRPTWARLIAMRYCALHADSCNLQPLEKGREVFLKFAGPPPLSFSIDEFFELHKQSEQGKCCEGTVLFKQSRDQVLAGLVKDKIVLLGGTFPQSGDFHPTPTSDREAGIVINARAIAAEMRGDNFNEIQQPWSFLLDLLTGFVVVLFMASLKKWLHWEPRRARIMILTSIAIAIFILLVFSQTHHIFSPAAVVLAALIQQLYDFWHENPEIVEQRARPNTAPQHHPRSRLK